MKWFTEWVDKRLVFADYDTNTRDMVKELYRSCVDGELYKKDGFLEALQSIVDAVKNIEKIAKTRKRYSVVFALAVTTLSSVTLFMDVVLMRVNILTWILLAITFVNWFTQVRNRKYGEFLERDCNECMRLINKMIELRNKYIESELECKSFRW